MKIASPTAASSRVTGPSSCGLVNHCSVSFAAQELCWNQSDLDQGLANPTSVCCQARKSKGQFW